MPEQTGASKAGGKNKKLGRWKKKPCNGSYKASNRRCRNKIKRVLQSSGIDAANLYSKTYGIPVPKVKEIIKKKKL